MGSARVYDPFTGPELDMSRWFFLEYPPELAGTAWRCEEPSATTEVSDGTVTITVERFERSHDAVQIVDNPKHLLLSTETIRVPEDHAIRFSIRMSARGIGASSRDYRDGFASVNVLDMASGWVFDVCATSDSVFAIHERLPVPGADRPFTHVVEEPLAGLDIAPGQAHDYAVVLRAQDHVAQWWADGRLIYEVMGAQIPEQVNLGLGLITLHPIVDGRSRSLRGQGLEARFGTITVEEVA